MGMFDYADVSGDEFKCSRGHSLEGEEFQTKDFINEMAHVTISVGFPVTSNVGCFGGKVENKPTLYAHVYCSCTECPAFVQAQTGNVIDCNVDFRVHVRDGVVLEVVRVSPSTEEFLEQEPKQKWMVGCFGPMTHAEAQAKQREIWSARSVESA